MAELEDELDELLLEVCFELDELPPDCCVELEELVVEEDFELDPEDVPDAGWAGEPSFTAMSRGPFTPGPKYFAVRS